MPWSSSAIERACPVISQKIASRFAILTTQPADGFPNLCKTRCGATPTQKLQAGIPDADCHSVTDVNPGGCPLESGAEALVSS